MGLPADKATQDQVLQFLTTEHFTLQTAKAAPGAEANERASLYRHQLNRCATIEKGLPTLFPSDPDPTAA